MDCGKIRLSFQNNLKRETETELLLEFLYTTENKRKLFHRNWHNVDEFSIFNISPNSHFIWLMKCFNLSATDDSMLIIINLVS